MLPEPKALSLVEMFELAKRKSTTPVERSSAHHGDGSEDTLLMFRLDHLTAFVNDLLAKAHLAAVEPFMNGEVVPVHIYFDTKLNVTRVTAPTTSDADSVRQIIESGLHAISSVDQHSGAPDGATVH